MKMFPKIVLTLLASLLFFLKIIIKRYYPEKQKFFTKQESIFLGKRSAKGKKEILAKVNTDKKNILSKEKVILIENKKNSVDKIDASNISKKFLIKEEKTLAEEKESLEKNNKSSLIKNIDATKKNDTKNIHLTKKNNLSQKIKIPLKKEFSSKNQKLVLLEKANYLDNKDDLVAEKKVLLDSISFESKSNFSAEKAVEENLANQEEKSSKLYNGEKFIIRSINIRGNRFTKNSIILKQLRFKVGDDITNKKIKDSKASLEFLDFFKRKNGVVLKVNKLDEISAEVEVILKEKNMSQLQAGVDYSPTPNDPDPALITTVAIKHENLFGRRVHAGAMIQLRWHELEQVALRFSKYDFLDSNIFTETNLYSKTLGYPYWIDAKQDPSENHYGVDFKFGFPLNKFSERLSFYTSFGFKKIKNNNPESDNSDLDEIINKRFKHGDLKWISCELEKDKRNYPVEPSRGYRLSAAVKTALPVVNKNFGFLKTELSGNWYYPLLDKDSLVFSLFGSIGSVSSLSSEKIIPYSELFHMGGPFNVRGFNWGQIEPSWDGENPLGGKYALQTNAEFSFPIINQPKLMLLREFKLKGRLFYDAGACWNTPKQKDSVKNKFIVDNFELRHSVGCGLSLLKPINLNFDLGYKLDRKKDESPYEITLTAHFAW